MHKCITIFVGGGFWFGNSNENGADYFMDEEVILVTLNYRLGALGEVFINHFELLTVSEETLHCYQDF